MASSLNSHDSAAAGTVCWFWSSRGQAFIGQGEDIDLIRERAFLGVEVVRVDRLMNAENLRFRVLCER